MASEHRFDRSQPHFKVTLFFEEGMDMVLLYGWDQALARGYEVGDWRHPWKGDGRAVAKHFCRGGLFDELVLQHGGCYRIKIETVEP